MQRWLLNQSSMQCTVDTSQELCDALACSLPEHFQQHPVPDLTLVILDSIGAFYPIDRACTITPASPRTPPPAAKGVGPETEFMLTGTNFAVPAPLGSRRTLPQVHAALVASIRALLRFPIVVFVTLNASTHVDAAWCLQHRPYLPSVWSVRTSNLSDRLYFF
jgi:hypothetical protein